MTKLSKIMFIIWMVLAIAAFVASFWAAGLVKIIGLVFGGLNILIMGSWLLAVIEGIVELNKQKKILEEN